MQNLIDFINTSYATCEEQIQQIWHRFNEDCFEQAKSLFEKHGIHIEILHQTNQHGVFLTDQKLSDSFIYVDEEDEDFKNNVYYICGLSFDGSPSPENNSDVSITLMGHLTHYEGIVELYSTDVFIEINQEMLLGEEPWPIQKAIKHEKDFTLFAKDLIALNKKKNEALVESEAIAHHRLWKQIMPLFREQGLDIERRFAHYSNAYQNGYFMFEVSQSSIVQLTPLHKDTPESYRIVGFTYTGQDNAAEYYFNLILYNTKHFTDSYQIHPEHDVITLSIPFSELNEPWKYGNQILKENVVKNSI